MAAHRLPVRHPQDGGRTQLDPVGEVTKREMSVGDGRVVVEQRRIRGCQPGGERFRVVDREPTEPDAASSLATG